MPATIAAVNPWAGPAAGGTKVTIEGAGFTEVKSVYFGDTRAQSFTVENDGRITAVSPPGTVGKSVAIVLSTAGEEVDLSEINAYLREKQEKMIGYQLDTKPPAQDFTYTSGEVIGLDVGPIPAFDLKKPEQTVGEWAGEVLNQEGGDLPQS